MSSGSSTGLPTGRRAETVADDPYSPIAAVRRRLGRFFAPLTGAEGATDDPLFNRLTQAGERLHAKLGERDRLRALVERERQRQAKLTDELGALEAKRHELLAAQAIAPDPHLSKQAEGLLTEAERLERSRRDAAGTADALQRKTEACDAEIRELSRAHTEALGRHLDGCMASLVGRYQELAPEVAEVVTEMLSLQATMVRLGTGNSNLHLRRAYLPDVRAGDARTRPAILDIDGPSARVSDRSAELVGELRLAGHIIRT
jgi:hypothetical protein